MDTEPVCFHLLGGCEISRGGVAVPGLVSAKARGLLAYLALTGREHSRDALVGLLWSELPEADARANLRQVLTQLRRVLPDHLAISRGAVGLAPAPRWVDVQALIEALRTTPAEVDAEELTRKLDLYRGDVLAGFQVRGAPDFDEWLASTRESVRQQVVEGVQCLADACQAHANPAAALVALARLVAIDPWREDAHRQLMRVRVELGQRPAALAQYERVRRILAEELGVEPEPETTALAEQIRAATSTPPTPSVRPTRMVSNAPAPLLELIGRESEMAALTGLLVRDRRRLVTLLGPGGVGKTRLAVECANRFEDAFPHGVCFVPLASVRDPGLVMPTIARHLNVREDSGRPLLEALREVLRDKQLLLVLDNFEQVAAVAVHLRELLAAARGLTALVTSRTPLHVSGEWEFPVAPLAVANPRQADDVDAVASAPATRLFVERAQAVHAGYELTPEDAPTVAAICHRLDGLPLAVELAAARMKTLSPRALLERLNRRLPLLTGGPQDMPLHQRTMREAIGWSYELLGQDARALFRQLGVFVDGCSLQAAEQVAGPEVLEGLRLLVDMSLLSPGQDLLGEPRFRMLETIREYALERLEVEDGALAQGVRRRHAEFFLRLACTAVPELVRPRQLDWLKRLEIEHANCGAALAWSAADDGDPALALRLGATLWPFWAMHGHISQGRAWLASALAAVDQAAGDRDQSADAWRATVLRGAGVLAQRQSDYPAARAYLTDSLALCEAGANTAGTAATLQGLGRLALDAGRFDEGRRLYERSLELFGRLGDSYGAAETLDGLINIARYHAEYDVALELAERALALQRELGNTRGVATALRQLSMLLRDQGRLAEAWAAGEECLALWREIGDPWGVAYALNALGNVARDTADYATAVQLLEECLAVQRRLGERQGAAYTMHQLGIVARDRGDLATARVLAEESLVEFRALGHRRGVAYALARLGTLLRHTGDHPGARAALAECLALVSELGDKRGLAVVFEELAPLAQAADRAVDAAHLLGAAEQLRQATRVPLTAGEQALRAETVAAGTGAPGAVGIRCGGGAGARADALGRDRSGPHGGRALCQSR